MDECRVENATNCGPGIKDLGCYLVFNTSLEKAFLTLLSCTVGSLGIIENVVVLCIILSSSCLRRNPSYLFLASVALADLLASVCFTYSFLDFHVFGETGSPTIFLLKLGGVIASFTVSLGSLLLTAFDRYICIHKPSAYKTLVTKKRALVALVLTWWLSVLIAFLPLMGWNCCKLKTLCSELFPLIDNKYLIFWISLVMLLLTFIAYSYSHILLKAHKHVVCMKYHRKQAGQTPEQVTMRMNVLLAKTLALVLAVIMLCWAPVLLLMMYSLFGSLSEGIKRAFAFCSNLCLLNCVVNPIVYSMRSRDMWHRLMKGLSCLRRRISGCDLEGTNEQKNSAAAIVSDETPGDTEVQ
ncbi:cannabinoid receptor 2 [Pleurodeles waltl]|uniref:cannabinoid receptor 2 n=1 Tax=Pleurodeles waltl TaxID=8319 RepID=UPI00370973F0